MHVAIYDYIWLFLIIYDYIWLYMLCIAMLRACPCSCWGKTWAAGWSDKKSGPFFLELRDSFEWPALQRFPFGFSICRYTWSEVSRSLKGSAPSIEQITCLRNPVSVFGRETGAQHFLLCWVLLPSDVSDEEPSDCNEMRIEHLLNWNIYRTGWLRQGRPSKAYLGALKSLRYSVNPSFLIVELRTPAMP